MNTCCLHGPHEGSQCFWSTVGRAILPCPGPGEHGVINKRVSVM